MSVISRKSQWPWFFWAVFAWLTHVGCAGQSGPPSTTPSQAATPERNTPGLFLYEVEKDGRVSWLLGTIHLGFAFDEVLTEAARKRFSAARTVVLETDITSADPTRMMNAALLPEDQSLRALMGEKTWKILVEKLGSTIPEPMLDRLAPWMPATILALSDIQKALESERPDAASHMMDRELIDRAKERQLAVVFLETVDEQIAIFAGIPQREQVSELTRELTEDQKDVGRHMVDAFAEGDEEALARALFDEEQMKLAPGFYEAVLFARNARWLTKLEELFSEGQVFVAVGAAHLLGDRGIIATLRNKGYRVVRVGS